MALQTRPDQADQALQVAQQTLARYVQDCLPAAAGELRAWVDDDAAIYGCGSLQGMAAASAE